MKIKYVLIAAFVLIVCFIWGNSMLSPETSGAISGAVKDLLAALFGSESGDSSDIELHFWVRKLAHFLEFAALGLVGSLLLRFYSCDRMIRWTCAAMIGGFFALTDETIQIFSRRGSSVRDVWIDIAGYIAGCLLAEFLIFLRRKIIAKRQKQT